MRKIRICTSVLLITFGFLIIHSCKKEDSIVKSDYSPPIQENFELTEGMIELSEPLENPYSVENMQKAYQSLKTSGTNFKSDVNIKVTHYYVRFLPKDYDELDLLKQDTTLILFDYPLDRKIKKGGTYYRDPSLPKEQPVTWQYTTVPIDYTFPSIKYEILAELFLEDANSSKFKSSISNSYAYEQIEIQSLKLTGNYNDSLYSSSRLKSSWSPSGTIQVTDSDLGSAFVVGAKVRVKNWFKVKEVLTNNNGYFNTESFNNAVDYSIKWEREDYDIREEDWGQAYYQGPNESKSAWNLTISGGMSFVYAHVHRAAYTYWYNNSYGIKTPPKNSFWTRKVKIGCYDKADRAFINVALRWTTFPEIYIYRYNSGGTLRSGRQLFRTGTHELAHSSHWDLSSWHYRNADDKVVESWAVGVVYVITNNVYGGIEDAWQGVTLNQMRTTYENKYTSLVIDLIDNFNQNPSLALNCPCGGYDGANCYVGTAPSGTTAFIYSNNFYYTPVNGNQCPLAGSSFDGANCFVRSIPSNTTGFIFNNSWYVQEQGLPIDRVSGYTLGQIETAMKNITSLEGWRNNLRDQNVNST
jgi:hypothetical protein